MSIYRRFGRHLLTTHTLPHQFENHAPGLKKWWKAWERTNGQIVEHISPYQQKIFTELFKDPVHKVAHLLQSHWYIIPPAIAANYIWYWTQKRFHEYEEEEWP